MCGVLGIIGVPEAAHEAFLGLTTLQHRGQDGAGILTYNEDGFHRVKNLGLVETVFTRENMISLKGEICIGHTRYSTAGRGEVNEVQPLLLSHPFGIGIVHNGNIINTEELANKLSTQGRRKLLTRSDTEVLLNLVAQALEQLPARTALELDFDSLARALKPVFTEVKGSYSAVMLIADLGLIGIRDPYGIRPLVIGCKKNGARFAYAFASESVALEFNGYELLRDVKPGEMVLIDASGTLHSKIIDQRKTRHCMFEWVYFASPESVIDGVPVYGSRIALGRALADSVRKRMKADGFEIDMVVPVPDSSRVAAIALSEELRVPYRELLIKNRYIKRTFILDSPDKRQMAVNLKLSPVKSEIKGKRVLLVDDSIVRGTTSRKIIELVRNAGAEKVYFVSTCPPIRYPCYYGIDFPNPHELIASGRDSSEVERELCADAVIYQDLEGLKASVSGQTERTPCMACLTGEYPTDVTDGKRFAEIRAHERRGNS